MLNTNDNDINVAIVKFLQTNINNTERIMEGFTHTVEQGLEAKKNLIEKTGLTESDFYLADKYYEELGIPEGAPMVKCSDDDSKSAFDLWNEWEFERLYGDDMADYFLENDLI